MFEGVKMVDEMEAEFERIREGCRDIIQHIDTYLFTLKLDDHYSEAAGYSRMMEIIEAKVQDIAR